MKMKEKMHFDIDKIKEQVNITELVQSYGLDIKNNMLKCPFHADKTPSMKLYTESNSFYCFGCGAAGDTIKFVELIENADFNGACEKLVQNFNIVGATSETKQKTIDFVELGKANYYLNEWSMTAYKYLSVYVKHTTDDNGRAEVTEWLDILLNGSVKAKQQFFIERSENNDIMLYVNFLKDVDIIKESEKIQIPENLDPVHIGETDTNFYNKYKKLQENSVFLSEHHSDERPVQEEKEEFPYYFYQNSKGSYKIDTKLLARYIRNENKYFFVRNQATEAVNRFIYKNGCYRQISDEELKAYIKSFVTAYDDTAYTMHNINEVFNDLTTDDNFIPNDKINENENIINFQNGLLYLDTMELKPHNPNILTTIQIPCNYNTTATDTTTFDNFIGHFTGGDWEKQKFLIQYMALCISNIKGYRIKKALFMVGDGNTGKSQLKGLTERLIGLENCSAVTLSDLEERFGTSNLYNKRLVGDSDMSFISVKELKMFKQVTGGDSIPVEFKGRTPFNYIYNGLMWFCMNELPRFSGDRGQWVYDRIIIFKADNVVSEEKRDKYLLDKMYAEREAIIAKYLIPALTGLLHNDIKIAIPAECTELSQQYQQDNNPVHRFYTECCTDRPDNKVSDNCTTKKMYEVFKAWCKDNNNGYVVSKPDFNKELVKILNVSDFKQIQKIIHGIRYYNFTLNLATKQDYNMVYGVDRVQ